VKKTTEPLVLTPSPSPLILILGGFIGTVLLSSWLFVAPVLGLGFIDVPHAIGGIVTSNPQIAFGIGIVLFFFGGTFVVAPLILSIWSTAPGSEMRLGGALLKGLLWGIALWFVTGVALGIATAINRVDAVLLPGFFGAAAGAAAVVWLLIGCLLYGITLTAIASVEHGVTALDTVGWTGYYHAATGPTWLDEHRSLDVPQPQPARGRRTP
jgi:hypothetical protein